MEEDSEEDVDNDVRNDDTEDEELLLEGSELYNYLTTFHNEGIEVYSHKKEQFPPCSQKLPFQNLAPKEIFEFTGKILHCNLLMEEDAAYLFKISSELSTVNPSFMHSKKWGCGLLFLEVVTFYSYLKLNKLRGILLPFITGSAVLLVSLLNIVFTKSAHEKKLIHLLDVLQKTFFLTKKIINVLIEDDALLASKEKFQWLSSRCDNQIQQECSFKRKITEIAVMSSKTATELRSLIRISRNITFSLLKFNRESKYRNEDYIALYSDEKLGIGKTVDSTGRPYNLALLHNLKNIYLLMQSECLRLLGICFCQCKTYDDIVILFQVVYTYTEESSSILKRLQNEHKQYFLLPFQQRDKCILRSQVFERNGLIHDVCRTLNGLLIEVMDLEDYIKENENSQEIVETVVSKIIKMENEFLMTLETFKRVKEYYIRYLSSNKTAAEVQNSSEGTKNDSSAANVTNINVGFSDFSITGADEVFLGSSDGVQDCSHENYEDFNEFKPPNTLIKELKVALVKKREEFEQREMKLLTSPNDIEAYKSCSGDSSLSSTQNSRKINEKELTPKNGLGLLENKTGESVIKYDEKNGEVGCNNPFQKTVAIAASNFSNHWSRMKEVDYFEDEFSD